MKRWYEEPVLILLLLIVLLVAVALTLLYTGKASLEQMLAIFKEPIAFVGAGLFTALGVKFPWGQAASELPTVTSGAISASTASTGQETPQEPPTG